jgi:hypothetical protein
VTTLEEAPLILAGPVSRTNFAGSTATFSVTAMATASLAYQWRFNGTNILIGQTNQILQLSAVTPTNAGEYEVIVTGGNSITSLVAVLTVRTPEAPAITGGQPLSDGTFQVAFSGPEGQTYTVLSADEATVPLAAWTALTNGVFGVGPAIHADATAANHPRRFYRIQSP